MTTTRRLHVTADVTICAGVRQCVLSDPTVFAHNDQNLVMVLQSEVDDHPELAEAIAMCPTGALSATDLETGNEVYP
jgi:ferredoxin